MSAHTNNDMNSSNRTIEGFIRYGKCTTPLIEFNDQTTMAVVNQHIHTWFNYLLPSAFHIEFYCDKKNIFLKLEEIVLNSELNPFQLDSNNSSQEVTSVMDYVQLFIVEDPSPDDQINSRTSTSELFEELDDILLSSPFVPNPSHEDLSQNNISSNNANEEGPDDDIIEENPITENSQIISLNSTTSSNEDQLAMETTDEKNTQSSRILFSHDVHPGQKHHYLSNKYNIDDGSDKNSGISCIQGRKTEEEIKKKMKVLPQLQIPQLYRMMKQLSLLIYAVHEEQEEGTRRWYKNQHKGFLLHHQLNADAEFFNPIKLTINETEWTKNGDYILEIYMLTNKRSKRSKIKQEVYQLGEEATIQIHTAKHIVSSERKHLKPTRLLAVLEINNELRWDTFGLSNFIQPPDKKDQPITLSDTTRIKIALPASNINLNTVGLPVIFQSSTKNSQSISLNAITAVQTTSPVPKRKKF